MELQILMEKTKQENLMKLFKSTLKNLETEYTARVDDYDDNIYLSVFTKEDFRRALGLLGAIGAFFSTSYLPEPELEFQICIRNYGLDLNDLVKMLPKS